MPINIDQLSESELIDLNHRSTAAIEGRSTRGGRKQ